MNKYRQSNSKKNKPKNTAQNQNLHVLITGVTSGIGKAIALKYAKPGVVLYLFGRDQKKLLTLKKTTERLGVAATIFCGSVTDDAFVKQSFAKIKHLDVAVNNAGVESRAVPIAKIEMADYDRVYDVNVRSLFHFCKLEIEIFMRNKVPGAIVNISSVAAFRGFPEKAIYCSSKAAVTTMTMSLAVECGPQNIRLNAVAPGGTETPMLRRVFPEGYKDLLPTIPLGRVADPTEIADAVIWLCSKEASFVTGTTLVVDGGCLAR